VAKINPIQMQKYFKGVKYPAAKDDLLKMAKQNGADENLTSVLEQLPDDKFETPAAVNKAVGQINK
jgi:hypothetical protein